MLIKKLITNLKENKYTLHILLILTILVSLLLAMKYFECSNVLFNFDNLKYTITTLIIWICVYLILKGITNKTKLSLSILIIIQILYDIINYIVRIVRGSPITISDIFAIRTALSVASNINIHFDIKFFIGILFVLTSIFILIIFRKKFIENNQNLKNRFLIIIIGFISIFILTKTNIYNSYSLWDMNQAYESLGSPLAILRMLHNYNIKPENGYNQNQIKDILKKYENTEKTTDNDLPNIIVIINESFCDYYNLYNDGNSNPIEYFTNLSKSENVISGVMYTSAFGGQTSNVEYEFLTQNSTRILPIGSYVFQQFITIPVKSSIVENLKSQGYKTSAIHPWESFSYSRNKVYKLFGFDSIKFKDDIKGLEKNFNNDFFSDKSTYAELLKEIKEKKKDEKIFEYILTVQNHTGYLNEDPKQIKYNDDKKKNIYMQLIHKSDEALEEVINELKKSEEKYILLFFGDHQPNLDDSDNFAERTYEQYEVPFLIWTNYDIDEQYDIKTSTIFLQNYLLKASGVNFSAMNNYMEELKNYYPVITKRFYMNTDGDIFINENDISDNYTKLEEYYKLNYYRIFDDK